MKKKYTKVFNSQDKQYLKLTSKTFLPYATSQTPVSAIYKYNPEYRCYDLVCIVDDPAGVGIGWQTRICDVRLWIKDHKATCEWVGENEIFLNKL